MRDGYQFELSQGGSAGFRPMGLTVITSNFGPNVQHKEQSDTGGQTRINLVTPKFIRSRNPVGANQRKTDAAGLRALLSATQASTERAAGGAHYARPRIRLSGFSLLLN